MARAFLAEVTASVVSSNAAVGSGSRSSSAGAGGVSTADEEEEDDEEDEDDEEEENEENEETDGSLSTLDVVGEGLECDQAWGRGGYACPIRCVRKLFYMHNVVRQSCLSPACEEVVPLFFVGWGRRWWPTLTSFSDEKA